MQLSRVRKGALSAAFAFSIAGQGVPSRAAELPSPGLGATSILRLDPFPLDAHVYVRDANSGRTIHVCTGPCSLTLRSGAYRIDAGFRHRELIRASDGLI